MVIVKAVGKMVHEDAKRMTEQRKRRTVNLLLFFHEQERIVLKVTVEMDIRSVGDVIRKLYSSAVGVQIASTGTKMAKVGAT